MNPHSTTPQSAPEAVKHSPLPWKAKGFQIEMENGSLVASAEPWINEDLDKANAAYIVTACNAFPALVEALKDINDEAWEDNEKPNAALRRIARITDKLLASLAPQSGS